MMKTCCTLKSVNSSVVQGGACHGMSVGVAALRKSGKNNSSALGGRLSETNRKRVRGALGIVSSIFTTSVYFLSFSS